MLVMSQINHIRDLKQSGYRISEIVKITGTDPKTIRKYIEMEDFSPELPPGIKQRPSKLDPFKPWINEWLEEDRKHWYKQHHTARRIYDRLVCEHAFDGSYDIVRRYVKNIRDSLKHQRANQELVWEPGYAQADFGEADFYEQGSCIRKKYLVLSFPYSNDGFCQVFGGETAECVCQGLQDISVLSAACRRSLSLIMQQASAEGSVIPSMNPHCFRNSGHTIISGRVSAIPALDGKKGTWKGKSVTRDTTCLSRFLTMMTSLPTTGRS